MQLRSYSCSLDGEHWNKINSTSAGKAKSEFIRELNFGGIKYTMIRCRVNGDIYTSEEFIRNAKYRNIEFARCGMDVQVGDWNGFIVGHNSSANLDVLAIDGRYQGQVVNCHPNWEITYFDKKGNIIKSFHSSPAGFPVNRNRNKK